MADYTLNEILGYGIRMLDAGWKVAWKEGDSDLKYVWTSPRGDEYRSFSINTPPEEAIDNAILNKDV